MYFFVSVLLLWVVAYALGDGAGAPLPPFTEWALYTVVLLVPGYVAWREDWVPLPNRLLGMTGFTLFVLCIVTKEAVVIGVLPVDAARPELWPTMYLILNIIIPLALVSSGMARIAVQEG